MPARGRDSVRTESSTRCLSAVTYLTFFSCSAQFSTTMSASLAGAACTDFTDCTK